MHVEGPPRYEVANPGPLHRLPQPEAGDKLIIQVAESATVTVQLPCKAQVRTPA